MSKEFRITFPSGNALTARVETRDGEDQLLIGWIDKNGKRLSQELWLTVKEAPSNLRALAAFADGLK